MPKKPIPVPELATESTIVEVEGLEHVAMLDQIIDALTAIKKLKLADLKPVMAQFFVMEAAEQEEVPKSFNAKEGCASATIQLRRRALKKGLDKNDIATLREFNIPMRTVGATLVVNPEFEDEAKIMGKLSKLLAANPDCGIPANFLIRLAPKVLPDENAIARILRLPPRDAIEVLPTVADLALTKVEVDGEPLREFSRNMERVLFGNDHNGPPELIR